MEPFRKRISRIILLLTVSSMVTGFLIPYWILHRWLTVEDFHSDSRRGARSIQNIFRPSSVARLEMPSLNVLNEGYYGDSDAIISSVSENDSKFIFIEVLSRETQYSYTLPYIDDKDSRRMNLQSDVNSVDEACCVFQDICQRKSRDMYSWTALVNNETYVNTFMLRHFLQRLPSSVPVLIGRFSHISGLLQNILY